MKVLLLFTFETAKTQASFLADITATDATDYATFSEWQDNMGMDEFQLNLECDFGVHDFAGFPDLVTKDKTILHMGFDSYEVTEDKLGDLMNKWTEEFTRLLGEGKVSPWFESPLQGRETTLKELYDRLQSHLLGRA